ncbi:MAG: amino acid ABC transporter ATP-binding protein [Candidatus Thiodiazotropha sp.]
MTAKISSKIDVDDFVLRVMGLTRRYGNLLALDNVSFELRRGEILGVIGPSGSGKTTLLRCLDLLEPFDAGCIEFFGKSAVRKADQGEIIIEDIDREHASLITEDSACNLRRSIGYVFQGFNLWNERTVLENLTLAPRVVQGERKEDANKRADILCHQFGLGDKLYARPWQLSGGQRQRVAILRALMMRPSIILLDEVTSALDPVLTIEVMASIRKLREEGLTMILVTHHLHFATKICNRLAFLAEGRIVQLDTPTRLQDAPANQEVSRFLTILEDAT